MFAFAFTFLKRNMTDAKQTQAKEKVVSVRGARVHNLKNISLDVPRNKFTVVTGVSGSGKSSLAFDTIYAEGQRRFVESLSAYARQFLERMEKPDVDSISGLPPAVAIEQKAPSKNPRSTVGTSTEIYDYFRLLYGRVGVTICKDCGETVKRDSPDSIVKKILEWEERTKLFILYKLNPKNGDIKPQIDRAKEKGFFRVLIGDSRDIIDLESSKIPQKTKVEDVFVLVDRMILKKDDENVSRLTDSIETALAAGEERVVIRNLSDGKDYKFSKLYECAECEIEYSEPEPRLFSFNNPQGACPVCQGFGRTIGVDDQLIMPDRTMTLKEGAVHVFRSQTHSVHQRELIRSAAKAGVRVDIPIYQLGEREMDFVMNGGGDYIGVNNFFKLIEEKNYKVQNRVLISKYRGYTKCAACGGSRLRTSARQVFVGGENIPSLIKKPLSKLFEFMKNAQLSETQREVAGRLLEEIVWRLNLLVEIGLGYLTLDRLSHTLSGGESQRINLSTALGSSLVGTLYALDEPSIGLHPRDTRRLINIIYKLRNLGNTILVVEHDLDIIKNADYIVDLGPKAGENGGEITARGTPEEIMQNPKSLTGKYLSGAANIPIPKRRNPGSGAKIKILNPRKHNLKMEKVEIPLGCMVAITGVSGSGKSTLALDILYNGLKKYDAGFRENPGSFRRIHGSEFVQSVELVDQSPIGKSSRSTPATYTKAFDFIRELYSQTQAARQLGLKPGSFSFNVPGGRCDVCDGEGSVKVDMQFLPDVHLQCEACGGTRYKREIRNVKYNGKSIVDVLNMTIDEAAEFFKATKKIQRKLQVLQEVGLGYLRLGQPSVMLSGGESQRVKLSNHLEAKTESGALFIFDEPTTGLHAHDVARLLKCFAQLIRKGHSVVVIEHNLHVVASCDWVVDLGPDAGEFGGELVAAGTPEQVAEAKDSHTGAALKEFLESIKD